MPEFGEIRDGRFRLSATYKRIRAAGKRLQEMGRLEFVLDLVKRDPAEMLEGELLDHRDLVRAFVDAWGWSDTLAADPLSLDTLQRIRQRVEGGLKILFLEGVPQVWGLEETFSLSVAPAPDDKPFSFPREDFGYRLPWPLKLQYRLKTPSVEALFVLGAASEIAARSEDIRKCRWCGDFFVKTTSQRFCSRQCTQAAVNAARAGRKRKPPFVVPPEQQKAIARATKAREQHRAGLEHDVTICPLCAVPDASSEERRKR